MNKSKLTKEELKEFFKLVESVDKKIDHANAARTLTSPLRRDIMKFIGYEIKIPDDIKTEFNLDEDQLSYHLGFLKQAYYIWESTEGWKMTLRGIGLMENSEMFQ